MAKAARGERPIHIMSKAQYLLLASFIGFYGLLFTYLLARAFAGVTRAHVTRVKPAIANVPHRMKAATRRRAWTNSVCRNA